MKVYLGGAPPLPLHERENEERGLLPIPHRLFSYHYILADPHPTQLFKTVTDAKRRVQGVSHG